jgi:hypothetical protein
MVRASRHAHLIDAREDGALDILIVTQIAFPPEFTGELFGGQGLD